MNAKHYFTLILVALSLALGGCATPPASDTGVRRSEAIAVIDKVNTYWQARTPAKQWAFWDVAAYHTGNIEAYRVTGNEAYRRYSEELDSSRTNCEMECPIVIMESTIGIGQAARLVGASVKTLQRWDREGRLVPTARTASNRRRYTESQLRAFLRLAPPATPRRTVVYCRARAQPSAPT